jgi:hypothetical protein
MTITLRRTVVGLATAGVMMAGGALAFAQGGGPGPALCFPVPGAQSLPTGAPGYAFVQPAPAAGQAFDNVCGSVTTVAQPPG